MDRGRFEGPITTMLRAKGVAEGGRGVVAHQGFPQAILPDRTIEDIGDVTAYTRTASIQWLHNTEGGKFFLLYITFSFSSFSFHPSMVMYFRTHVDHSGAIPGQ